MKRLILVLAVAVMFVSCSANKAVTQGEAASPKAEEVKAAEVIAEKTAVKESKFILKFDKGETFTPHDTFTEASLTKEHATEGEKYRMKITYKGKGSVGEFGPTRAFWGDYPKVCFNVFSESPVERNMIFRVKGAKEPLNGPQNTLDAKIKVPSGESVQVIDMTKELCNDGKSLVDASKVYLYGISNREEEPLVIYVGSFRLVK